MSDASAQQDELFVGEPAEQLNDSRAPILWRLHLAGWLGQPGVVALVEGVALLSSFCFAPWFFWRGIFDIPSRISPQGDKVLLFIDSNHLYSGWAMAQGVMIESAFGLFHAVFFYLWLIPLSAVALLIFGGLRLRHLVSARLAARALLACSALGLLVEVVGDVQTLSIQHTLAAGFVNVGVSWGFAGAVGMNAAAIAIGVALLKPMYLRPRAKRTAEGTAG